MIAAIIVALGCVMALFVLTDERYRRDARRWGSYLARRYLPWAAQPRVRPYHCDCECLHPHRDREPTWHSAQVCFPMREYIASDFSSSPESE